LWAERPGEQAVACLIDAGSDYSKTYTATAFQSPVRLGQQFCARLKFILEDALDPPLDGASFARRISRNASNKNVLSRLLAHRRRLFSKIQSTAFQAEALLEILGAREALQDDKC
jgi:hypothetical protein